MKIQSQIKLYFLTKKGAQRTKDIVNFMEDIFSEIKINDKLTSKYSKDTKKMIIYNKH